MTTLKELIINATNPQIDEESKKAGYPSAKEYKQACELLDQKIKAIMDKAQELNQKEVELNTLQIELRNDNETIKNTIQLLKNQITSLNTTMANIYNELASHKISPQCSRCDLFNACQDYALECKLLFESIQEILKEV